MKKKTEKIQIEIDMQNQCSLSFIPGLIFEDLEHVDGSNSKSERYVVVCLFGDIRLLYFDSIDVIELGLPEPSSDTQWERLHLSH